MAMRTAMLALVLLLTACGQSVHVPRPGAGGADDPAGEPDHPRGTVPRRPC